MDILGRFSDLKKITSITDLPRQKAIEEYLADGGVLKFEKDKLIYPDKERIKSQLDSAIQKRDYLNSVIRELKKRHNEFEYDSVAKKVTRVFDPLYWEHLSKMYRDEEYKVAFEKVEPPIGRIKDPKYRGIVKMFVKDDEYRKRMLEAKTSIIGENSGTVRESIEKNLESSRKMMSARLEKVRKERKIFDDKIKFLKVITKIAEESERMENISEKKVSGEINEKTILE